MADTYPPAHHLLRDLRLSFAHDMDARKSRAWMPVVEELCNEAGAARAGVIATLVDVIGGGLAAAAADPDWIATADLTLHMVRGHMVDGAPPGSVIEARAQVLRAGRTTVVLQVDLVDEHDHELGLATMSFSVLPRREINPDVSASRSGDRTTMATDASGLTATLLDTLGVETIDAAHGAIELPVSPWASNSMGAMQGGVVAIAADIAAETALRAATGRPVVVTDLQLTYLGFGRVGPVRTRADVLAPHIARVEIVDTGAENRCMTVANVIAT
jgi:uncharacterized protein (TIGR00369 family)